MKPSRRSFPFIPLLTVAAVYLSVSFILRLVMWWSFGRPSEVPPWHLLWILSLGAVNDLAELLYLLAPLSLYLFLLPSRIARSAWHRRFFALSTYLVLVGMLYISATEYFFFEEFDSRFNLVAVDYLVYPHEVWGNIRDSYPVLPFLLASGLISVGLFKLIWPLLGGWLRQAPDLAVRSKVLGTHVLLLALVVAGYSTDTLALSANRVENELTENGISSLFRSFRNLELDYNLYYRTIDRDRAYGLMRDNLAKGGGTFDDPAVDYLDRSFDADRSGLGKMNVVVIVEESLGAGFVGAYGDRRGLSPNLDRLAGQGLLFQNAYATGTRTVRGLEAITASFPPIPSVSILRRPGNEGIATWGKVMQENGYVTSFLYGGYGYFDNMNHFYKNNGFAISDRTDIEHVTFANIWGVCDENLFDHALGYFDDLYQQNRPFFSIIMTTSNHKPFTFPQGIPGVPAEGGGRKAGVRYADYALGRFVAGAARHPWFGDTLFVIVADHDARVYGRAQIPVRHYRIPLLIYAPGKVKPGTVETATSQMDIAPTVLGLLGLPYTAPFYGRNVLKVRPGEPHPVPLSHNLDVALYQDGKLAVLGMDARHEVFRYDAKADRLVPAEADPALTDLATAFYQTAFDLFKSHRYE